MLRPRQPFDALRFGLFAAHRVGDAGGDIGAGVFGGGAKRGLFAFGGDRAAGGAALVHHACLHAIARPVQSGVSDERKKGDDERRDDPADAVAQNQTSLTLR